MAAEDALMECLADADHLCGPDDFADVILAARRDANGEESCFGNISDSGVRRLIRLVYYVSQAPNEGRFPRLRLLVPARGEEINPVVPLHDELTMTCLHRIGPTLASQDHALVIHEDGPTLRITGIAALRGLLTEMSLGDPTARPLARPKGLSVEVSGPGHLRAGEHRMHRLQAGALEQEVSFVFEWWFREWYEEAANDLFGWPPEDGPVDTSWPQLPGFPVANVWLRLLRKAADLRHGACFVILPDPDRAPIGHSFRTAGCDLGGILASCFEALRATRRSGPTTLTPEEFRNRLLRRERLLSAIDAVARLSATDGCVVFNRRLQLHSFGSMIKVPDGESDTIPCLWGNSATPLDAATFRSFGTRRRSAVHLCRACPNALAFVISQDGDLHLAINHSGHVRFYDNAAYW